MGKLKAENSQLRALQPGWGASFWTLSSAKKKGKAKVLVCMLDSHLQHYPTQSKPFPALVKLGEGAARES